MFEMARALIEFLISNKIEIGSMEGNRIVFVSAKMPPKAIQNQLQATVPENVVCEFIEGPSSQTIAAVAYLGKRLGATGLKPDFKDHKVTLDFLGDMDIQNEDWNNVKGVIQDDEYIQKCDISIEGNLVFTYDRNGSAIQTNPDREVISKDDLTDLKIALGKCETVEDFINSL